MLKRLTIPVLITLLVVACQPNPAPVKLSISSRMPAASAANVPVDSVVAVTFNVAIKLATLDDNFTLSQGDTPVDGTVVYDPSTRVATFTPTAPLLNDTVYTATVGAAVESHQGARLGADSKWSFTTASVVIVPSVTSVTIVGGDFSLLPAETETLLVDVVVVDGADAAVEWTSSDDTVATVDASGVVTAVAPGAATITATSTFDNTKSDSVTATVNPSPAVTAVEIDQATPATTVGGTVTLTATVTAVGGADESVTWASAADAVATVDAASGVVTGVASGTVTITATSTFDASVSDTVDVVVAEPLSYTASAYPTTVGAATIDNVISILPPTTTSAGHGALSYALTGGALPPAFVVDNGVMAPETYEIVLDENTGEIRGSTGWPGVFTGTVTVTDELGQTADLTFSITGVLDFEVYNSEGTATQSTFPYTSTTETVVPGDRIRVSGVDNTLWLPADFASGLAFSLNFTSVVPDAGGALPDEAFLVNASEGVVSLGTALDTQLWSYGLVLDYDGASVTVPLLFEGENYVVP
ncbi:MAG TPA: Ig-like domain-containing protein [Trueperaceae bacterium]|nr:Ig-like domain-containing protein [Trueperaceae bacterium]